MSWRNRMQRVIMSVWCAIGIMRLWFSIGISIEAVISFSPMLGLLRREW